MSFCGVFVKILNSSNKLGSPCAAACRSERDPKFLKLTNTLVFKLIWPRCNTAMSPQDGRNHLFYFVSAPPHGNYENKITLLLSFGLMSSIHLYKQTIKYIQYPAFNHASSIATPIPTWGHVAGGVCPCLLQTHVSDNI